MNVIIAVSLIVISLAIVLHFSDEVFAAVLLPAVFAEEGTENTLQEQAAVSDESAGQEEGPEAADAVMHAPAEKNPKADIAAEPDKAESADGAADGFGAADDTAGTESKSGITGDTAGAAMITALRKNRKEENQ